MITGNEPAFPDPLRGGEQSIVNQAPHNEPIGLTKREYIATHALQGILSGRDTNTIVSRGLWGRIASESVKIADTLIAELNIPTGNP
jgi:hypothetical protein